MSRNYIPISTRVLVRLIVVLAMACALAAPAFAQTTDGGTDITNTASASYSDGSNSYNVTSNTVIVKVSNVAGLVITVTNTGNFSDKVQFLALGASIRLSGTATGTITRAVIDNGSGGTANVIDGTDTDIKGNAAVVISPLMARNTSIHVLVEVSVGAGATTARMLTTRQTKFARAIPAAQLLPMAMPSTTTSKR